MNAHQWIALSAVVATFQISACSGDDDDNGTNAGTGGTRSSGGSSARGGSSGRAGNSGRAGSTGASGRAGQGGTGASGGTAGRSGTGGTAGQVTTGGTAGRSATGGTGGRGGTAGQTAGRGGTTAGTLGAGSGGLGEAGAAANAGMGGAAGESGGGGEGGAVAQLSDGEILDVASTANQGEVAEAQVAITRASATAVHDFAQMMITDHTAANTNVVAVSTSTGIALTANPVSVRLMSETEQELSLLNAASGAAFDTLYIGEQITDHENVLALLNGTLIIEVQNADVRALLESMKTTVQAHLTAAEQIRDSL